MSERPELGDIKPGDEVFIVRSYNDMRGRKPEARYIPAEVVKASRVWIELKASEEAGAWRFLTWRMRRDTQAEASQYSGSNARFVTVEQRAWEEHRRWAMEYLRAQGLTIESRSIWCGREDELARLLQAAGA